MQQVPIGEHPEEIVAQIMAEAKKAAQQTPGYQHEIRKWNENRNMTFKQRKGRDELKSMQNKLDEANDLILSPFVVSTKDDDMELF